MRQFQSSRFIIAFILFISTGFAANKIAVATKVQGSAKIIHTDTKDETSLNQGAILEDGDKVITGSTGFVAVVFIDDKSVLKIKQDTEIELTGKRTANAIAKKMNIDVGTVRAKVSKQRTGEFILQSPTSVASVKGTDFWFQSDPFSGDMLFSLEGLVNFMNLISGDSYDIPSGFTGSSSPDGSITMDETDESEIPEDPDEGEEEPGSELEIQFEAPNGEIRTLIIHYQ